MVSKMIATYIRQIIGSMTTLWLGLFTRGCTLRTSVVDLHLIIAIGNSENAYSWQQMLLFGAPF